MKTFHTRGKAFDYWCKLLKANGIQYEDTKAMFDIQFCILNCLPDDFPDYKTYSRKYERDEHKFYFEATRIVPDNIKKYSLWEEVTDSKGKTWNNYGWHIQQGDQFTQIVDLLKVEPHSRRAVLTLTDRKYESYVIDMPCTAMVHFYILHNRLHASVTMRSNDVFMGFCYDTKWWGHTVLSALLIELQEVHKTLEIGHLIWKVTNFHIYDKHLSLIP